MKYIILISLSIFISGCATGPRYENLKREGSATIHNSLENPFKVMLSDETNVLIAEIDGVQTPGSRKGEFYVSEGYHELAVMIMRDAYEYSTAYVDIVAEANHHYKFEAKTIGMSYYVTLRDITDPTKPVTLKKFKIGRSSSGERPTIPIAI